MNSTGQLSRSLFMVLLLSWMLGTSGCQDGNVGNIVTATIPASGGTITLQGIASVNFPAGAFTVEQEVIIETTSDPDTNELFTLTSAIFGAGSRSVYEVRINTGASQPQSETVSVSLDIPNDLGDPAKIQVFAQVFEGIENESNDGFDELYDRFVVYPSTLDTGSGQLQLELPWTVFSAGRRDDDSHEATLILAVTPVSSSGAGPFLLAADTCPEGIDTIGPPLVTLTKIRGFSQNPTTINGITKSIHPGVDYVANDGAAVKAVGEGTVVKAVESNGKSLDEDNGGAGGTIVVEIPGAGRVQYMHLKKDSMLVKQGDKVKFGQKIAEADNTGFSKGAHLHLEFKPENSNQRIDPELCLDQDKRVFGDVLEGVFSATQERLYFDERRIEGVSGTLRWEFLYEFPDMPGMPALRAYKLTQLAASVTQYENSIETCVVNDSPADISINGDSLLYIYPTLKKYVLGVRMVGTNLNATCTSKEDGKVEASTISVMMDWDYDLAPKCVTNDPSFPEDFVEYPLTGNGILEDFYSLEGCDEGSVGTVNASGSWSLASPAPTL